jgi:ligand-binding SRPBCC domain-containing protein
MPRFERSLCLCRPPSEVLAFFLRPANLLALTPPELNLQFLDGPEVLTLGARLTWKGRRWGISRQVVTEITALEPDRLLIEEQREGPLRKWRRTLRFEPAAEGTCVTETVEFEPPGGALGLVVTAGAIERELQAAFAYREQRLPELLGGAAADPTDPA